jgi:hypothetical protein
MCVDVATTVNKAHLYKTLQLSNAQYAPKLKFKKSVVPLAHAQDIAALMEAITGDVVRVTGGNRGWFIERWTGSEWVKG